VSRPRALAAGVLLAIAVALAATAAPARERPAELGRMAAQGAVTLSAAGGAGHAIITATSLRPGQSVSGLIALANVGESRGKLTLRRTAMTDAPGRYGGRLSDALVLRVEQLGGGSWSGPLAGPGTLELGVMEPGEGRSYKLTLTLPDGGPHGADNRVQGSSVTIDWAWTTESAGPPPAITPTPSATPVPAATPVPTATPAPEPPLPVRGAPRLALRVPHQRVLATRGIAVYGSCDRPCRVSFRARITTAPRRGRGRVLQRGRVFRRLGAARRLPSTGDAERRLRLKLTPRAVRTLKRTMHHRGRVAVVIDARVRGAGGTRTVTRRIILRRAARSGASRGSALRR
jgi:hypothetical protein